MGAKVVDGRRFSWDDIKRKEVRKDHGVDLADMPAAFSRPTLEMESQPDQQDGWRFKILGLSRQTVVVVVYTERDNGNEIRLITAWRANKLEQALYYREVFGEPY